MKTKSIKQIVLWILLVVFLVMGLSACGTAATTTNQSPSATQGNSSVSPSSAPSAQAKPIYIALVGPMTGDNQQYGEAFKNSAQMVVEKVNKEGGINGSQLIVDYFDDKNDQKEDVTVAQQIVSANKYFMVVGSQSSGCSMAMAPIIQKAGLIQFSPISSNPNFTKLGENIFTMNYTMQYCGPVWGDFIVDFYKSRKPGLIYVNNDYGNSVYQFTSERLKQYKLDYAVVQTYDANAVKDFTSMLTKIKDAKCDLLCIRGPYADTAQIVLQAKQLDMDMPISIDGMSGNTEFLKIAGEAAEGVSYVDTMFLSNTEEPFASFRKDYEAKYNKIVDNYSTQAYDTFNLIVAALRKHGTNTKAVRDELANTKGYKGVSGTINMGADRTRDAVFYIIQVKDGKFVKVGDLDKKPDGFVCPDLSK